MSDTRVSVLTPAGTGAIATVAVAGPRAWDVVRAHFRPAGKPLPEAPPLLCSWFGSLGERGAGDEVVVAVTAVEPEPVVEVHCHGGVRVVRWVVERFAADGCVEVPWADFGPHDPAFDERALVPLTRTTTLRTASILLDQYHGAFRTAVAAAVTALDAGDGTPLRELARFAPLGRHLVSPWKVVVAGPPNAGKSSLINALAGYQRAVVSPVAGTTRDAVTVMVAFDGWPVELTDTAGLRDTAEELEAAGIGLARTVAATADLIVWLTDATDPDPPACPPNVGRRIEVRNKIDLPGAARPGVCDIERGVSAVTGAGVAELGDLIARVLVPVAPPPGAAVPFTPALAEAVERAAVALAAGDVAAAKAALVGCVDSST